MKWLTKCPKKALKEVVIPTYPYYVLSRDTFMSGWGSCEYKDNWCVVPCMHLEIAEGVKQYIETRREQKDVKIISFLPPANENIVYSDMTAWVKAAYHKNHINPKAISREALKELEYRLAEK